MQLAVDAWHFPGTQWVVWGEVSFNLLALFYHHTQLQLLVNPAPSFSFCPRVAGGLSQV